MSDEAGEKDIEALCDELERLDSEMTPAPWLVDEDGDVVALTGPGPASVDGTMVQARCDLDIGRGRGSEPVCVARAVGIAYLRNNTSRIASELRRLMRVEAAAAELMAAYGEGCVGRYYSGLRAALRGDP